MMTILLSSIGKLAETSSILLFRENAIPCPYCDGFGCELCDYTGFKELS